MNLPKSRPGLLVQGENVLLFIEGETHSISKTTCPKFDDVLSAFEEERYDDIPALINVRQGLKKFLTKSKLTNVEFGEDIVKLNGEALASGLQDLLLKFYYAGAPMAPYIELLERLENVPTATIREELLLWIAASNLVITTNGKLYAYRAVKVYAGEKREGVNYPIQAGDLVDKYTSTWRNNVGDICKMKRSHVNDKRNMTCESGLHFASLKYAEGTYGNSSDAIIIVEVDPNDVVAIPSDYSNQKGRCSKFKVISIARQPGSGVLNERALGDAPAASNEEVVAASKADRWQLHDSNSKVVGTYPSRGKAYTARDTMLPGSKLHDTWASK